MATIMDPRFKDKFFSGAVNQQSAKKLLLDKYMKIRENDPYYRTAEPSSKRPTNDKTTSKLWVVYQKYCPKHSLYLEKIKMQTVFHVK